MVFRTQIYKMLITIMAVNAPRDAPIQQEKYNNFYYSRNK